MMEVQKIQDILAKKGDPKHKVVLGILARLGFLFYWFFDNLAILSKVKFLNSVNTADAAKKGATMWLTGLFFSIILILIEIYETSMQESKLYALKKEGSLDSNGEA